ncbi:MAG: hypothetical protein HQL51_16355 [Magnetococcales bacterium]|nr:hypothetical protein [Magnetococcales bacterium]
MNPPLDRMTLLIDPRHLAHRVEELAEQISRDMTGRHPVLRHPVLAVVLKGGFLFGADLVKALKEPAPVVFIHPGEENQSPFITPPDQRLLQGRDVVLVDILLDSGEGLRRVIEAVEALHPASLRLAVFLHRTVPEAEPLTVHYLGFEVPEMRLVGYGLAEEQRFRGLPAIYTWRPESLLPKA